MDLDRLMGNPVVDHVAPKLAAAKAAFAQAAVSAAPATRGRRPRSPRSPAPYSNGKLRDADAGVDGDALVMTLTTGAKLRLEPRDGDVFLASSCRRAASRQSPPIRPRRSALRNSSSTRTASLERDTP